MIVPVSVKGTLFDALPLTDSYTAFGMHSQTLDNSFQPSLISNESNISGHFGQGGLNASDTTRSQTPSTDTSSENNSPQSSAGQTDLPTPTSAGPAPQIPNLNVALQQASNLDSTFANFNGPDLFNFNNNGILHYPMLSQFGRTGQQIISKRVILSLDCKSRIWPNICDEYVEDGGTGQSSNDVERVRGRRCSITFPTFFGKNDKDEIIKFCDILYPDYLIDYSLTEGKTENLITKPGRLTCTYRNEYTCGPNAISLKELCFTIHKEEVKHEAAKEICAKDNAIVAKADEDVLAFFVRMFMIDDVYAYWVDGYGRQVGQPSIYVVQLDPLSHRRFRGELLSVKGEELHSVLCSKKAEKYPTLPIAENVEFKSIGTNCTLMQHFNIKALEQDDYCFYWTQSVVGTRRVVQNGKEKSEAYVNVDHFHQKCKFGGFASYAVSPSAEKNYDTLKKMQNLFKPNSDILLPAVMTENWPVFNLTVTQNNKKKTEDDIAGKNEELKNKIAKIARLSGEKLVAEKNLTTTETVLTDVNVLLKNTIAEKTRLSGEKLVAETNLTTTETVLNATNLLLKITIAAKRTLEDDKKTTEDNMNRDIKTKGQVNSDIGLLDKELLKYPGHSTEPLNKQEAAARDNDKMKNDEKENTLVEVPSSESDAKYNETITSKKKLEQQLADLNRAIVSYKSSIKAINKKINTADLQIKNHNEGVTKLTTAIKSTSETIAGLAINISQVTEQINNYTTEINRLNEVIKTTKDTITVLTNDIVAAEKQKEDLQNGIIKLEGQLQTTIMSLWDNHRKCQDVFSYSRDGGEQWKVPHNSYWEDLGYLGQPVYYPGTYNPYHFPATLLVLNKKQKLANTMAARRGPIVCAQELIDQRKKYSCPADSFLHHREREGPVCYKFVMLAKNADYKAASEECSKTAGSQVAKMQNKGEEDAIIASINKIKVKSEEKYVPVWLRIKQKDKETSNGSIRCLHTLPHPDKTRHWDESDCKDKDVGVVCETQVTSEFMKVD